MFTIMPKIVAVLMVVPALGTAQATRVAPDTTSGPPEAPGAARQVVPPAGPVSLELPARTAYDPDTLWKVRPRFDAWVRQVHVTSGREVHTNDPLVDLESSELASAKSDFQTKFVQWQHDRKLHDLREKLAQTGAILNPLRDAARNDERKSHLDYELALDKLQVYEVSEQEIASLIARLKDQGKEIEVKKLGAVSEKAAITLRARSDGIVIEHEALAGGFAKKGQELMVIAPLDHLWVLADLPEKNRFQVKVRQKVEVQSPLFEQTIQGVVQYVAPEVSPDTRSVQVRASIPNPDGRLRAGMGVRLRMQLEGP